jgi:hypothetical protein
MEPDSRYRTGKPSRVLEERKKVGIEVAEEDFGKSAVPHQLSRLGHDHGGVFAFRCDKCESARVQPSPLKVSEDAFMPRRRE